MIKLARPDLGDEEIAAAAAVLRSGHLVQGPEVAAFEKELSDHLGLGHLAAMANGTAALHLALLAAGIQPGDKVAVPTFSWPATANVVELIGATPIFVDIEDVTYGMAPDALEGCLTSVKGIKAVMPVHAFGAMARIDELHRLCGQHGVILIEDAACALGCALHGRQAGTWGALGCFSFHPRKAITTGEGGAIVAADAAHLRSIRELRNHGLDPEASGPDFVIAGFNYRLSEMQAAIGRVQVRRLDRLIARRRELARLYDKALSAFPVTCPRAASTESHVYQSYVVLLHDELAPRRGAIIARLRESGVESTIGTYHMPLLTFFRERYGHAPGDHPVGESVASRALSLPIHSAMTDSDVQTVANALRDAL